MAMISAHQQIGRHCRHTSKNERRFKIRVDSDRRRVFSVCAMSPQLVAEHFELCYFIIPAEALLGTCSKPSLELAAR